MPGWLGLGVGRFIKQRMWWAVAPIIITPPVISVLTLLTLIVDLQILTPAVFSGGLSESVQWQRSTDGGTTYNNISNGLNLNLLAGGLVRVQVTSTNAVGSTTATSNVINVGIL